MSKPTILVVPGAWHVPEHYAAITSFMKAKGYPVICKQNRTCGTEDATMNADDDAVAIRKEIDSIDGGVIITMHSYGGVPGSVAANGAANVIGLIFISSFVIPPGSTLMDAPQNNDDSERDEFDIDPEKGTIWNTQPRTTFYHDVDEDKAQEAIKLLKSQNLSAFSTPSGPTSWPVLPKIYFVCTDDQMLPTWTQETMLAQAGDWVEVKRMDAGHSPWMSREEEFNTWFESAVQKLVGLKADK